MSHKKSDIGNNWAFHSGSNNPHRRDKRTNRNGKAEENEGTFYVRGDKVFVVIDEKGPHLIKEESFLKPKNFCIKEPYENVMLFIKDGLNLSERDINKFFLEA